MPVAGFRMVAFGEYADDGTASTMKARDYKDATDLAVIAAHGQENAVAYSVSLRGREGDITHTLKAEGFDGSKDGTGRGTPIVPVAAFAENSRAEIRLEGGEVTGCRRSSSGGGDKAHVLIAFSSKDYGGDATVDMSPTLRACGHTNSHANAGAPPAVAYPILEVGKRTGTSTTDPRAGLGIGSDGDPMFTLQAGAQHGVAAFAENSRQEVRFEGGDGQITGALSSGGGKAGQGYPDGHTDVPYRGKPASDGPRYKAIGNSMAVPCMAWIGQRIKLHLEEL